MELGLWSKMVLYSSVQFELFMLWMLCRCFLCFISCMNVNYKYLLLFENCFQKPTFLYICYIYELLVYYLQLYMCYAYLLYFLYFSFKPARFLSFTFVLMKFSDTVFCLVIPILLICIVIQIKPIKHSLLLEVPEHYWPRSLGSRL